MEASQAIDDEARKKELEFLERLEAEGLITKPELEGPLPLLTPVRLNFSLSSAIIKDRK